MKRTGLIVMCASVLILGIGCYWLFSNEEKKIRKSVTELQDAFRKPPSSNLIEKATSILRICQKFTDDFQGSIDRISIRDERSLKETVSWTIQLLAPLETLVDFESIRIQKPEAEAVVTLSILESREPELHRPEYRLKVTFFKSKNRWLLRSAEEIK